MKNKRNLTTRIGMCLLGLLTLTLSAQAANTKTRVEQVTTTVALIDDVDYIITSDTPFGDEGIVNIANTDHAVLIIECMKPSAVTSAFLKKHVQINGQEASAANCQVKIYNRGAIIMPYANNIKPLTVYSEPNFEGESVNSFGLENDNGFMNTLTPAKLNNRIRSFKLKRGYMVTFANRPGGRGYSRCFIAADADLEVAELPAVLDRSISSYRVFKWYDTSKVGLAAAAGDYNACNALNVTSTYTWSAGSSMAPDIEVVPHQIYSGYPSASACGRVDFSPHMKTSNEPRNSADDHPEDLNAILNNWESLMRTGMRLCTPSSWDGSDYWNGTGFLKTFLDSIDARGWRCDIVDMHCYWAEGSFPNLNNWHIGNRPIWISEWCLGASWNNNGAFASGVTEEQVKDALTRICNSLNGMAYVERYFYWNGERDPSRLYKNRQLTPAGKMYSQLNSGVGYNGKYINIPKTPKQYDPANLVVTYDKNTNTATLTWHEYNGELNQSITVQRRNSSTSSWRDIADITMQEEEADYTYEDHEAINGCEYRIQIVDANGTTRRTKVVMAASDNLEAGDAIDLNGVTKYLGGNIIANGSFDMGAFGWLNGAGEPISQPYFQVVPVGGADGGTYLQAYGNGALTTNEAVRTIFDVNKNSDYYFSGAVCNTTSVFAQLNFINEDGSNATSAIPGSLNNQTSNWLTQFSTFNTGEFSKVAICFRTLGGKAQFDQLMVCQLFDTKEEALADGQEKARLQAETFKAYNTLYPSLNEGLPENLKDAIKAYHNMPRLQALIAKAEQLATLELYGSEELKQAINAAQQATTAIDVNEQTEALANAIDTYIPLVDATPQPKNGKFAAATGWTTKCGTYTGGDQRTNSKDGVTFWNAWWSGLSASEGTSKTMEIKQDISVPGNKNGYHGLYALECKATTEHYCLSDQHGYISTADATLPTPNLTADYFDLPTIDNEERWQTLLTAPVYIPDGGSLTIGFVGSKEGATDNAWHKLGDSNNKGDMREGWWCATDFVLKYHPMYKTTVTPNQWGVICLPYAFRACEGMKLYQIAGINSDYTKLCLEEIESTGAGVPCIYRSEKEDVTFLEYGPVTTSTTDAPGNIRGFITTTASVPVGYFYLENGEWKKVTDSSNRPRMTNYTGIIRPFADNNSKRLTVFEDWAGETMNIIGVTEEDIAADVKLPTVTTLTADGIYTIDGRMTDGNTLKGGIYIKVENGHAQKMIIK